MHSYGVLGVPSSAAAHWPGQEKAPAALRAAGLLDRLRARGATVRDYGDRPVARWQADPQERHLHSRSTVLAVLDDAEKQLVAIHRDGYVPLLLGGECSLALAQVSAATRAGGPVALIYFDGGPDLTMPQENRSGVIDSMGVTHLLDLPGADAALSGRGARRPLLSPGDVCFFAFGMEDPPLRTLGSPLVPVADVAADPPAGARAALAALGAGAQRFVLHLDVDVIDFYDLPVADVPQHNCGLTLVEAMAALAVFADHPGCVAITVAEYNPDHGDYVTADRLTAGLARALTESPSLRF